MTLPSPEAIAAQIKGQSAAAAPVTPLPTPVNNNTVAGATLDTMRANDKKSSKPVLPKTAQIVASIAAPKPAINFNNVNVSQTMANKSFADFAPPDPSAVPKEVQDGLKRLQLRQPDGYIYPVKSDAAPAAPIPNTEITAGKPSLSQEIVHKLPDSIQRFAEQVLQTGSDLMSIMPTAMRDNNEKVRLWGGRLEDMGVPSDRATDLAANYYFSTQKGIPGSDEAKVAAAAQKQFLSLKPTPDEIKSLKTSSFKQGLGTAFDIVGSIGGPEEAGGKEGLKAAGGFLDHLIGAPGDIVHGLVVGNDKASTIDALARAVQLRQASRDQAVPEITNILKKAGVEHGIAEQYAPILAGSDFEGIKKGINAIDKLQGTSKIVVPAAGTAAKAFEGFDDLSLKTLDKLVGRTTVSKTFIQDLTNQGDLKQPEREAIRSALEGEGDTVNVADFANKVKAELLPLDRSKAIISNKEKGLVYPEGGGLAISPKYEGITLPSELRGDVENYSEHVYQSPIKTAAGSVHFGNDTEGAAKNYFAHSRIEDLPPDSYKEGEYAPAPGTNGTTRRVIEIQSDLFQKGRLEGELPFEEERAANAREQMKTPGKTEVLINGKWVEASDALKQFEQRKSEIAALEPFRNTWHERVIREEIKQAAKDGKTALQFPTGETAMKIEGLGSGTTWRDDAGRVLNPDEIYAGKTVNQGAGDFESGDDWVVTDVLGNGKFKAVLAGDLPPEYGHGAIEFDDLKIADSDKETFDISGKIDTENPIYKFYEKTVGKYLTNKYGAKLVTDAQGVKWWEVPIDSKYAKAPVHAFGAGAGFSKDKDGKWHYDPIKGALGAVAAGFVSRNPEALKALEPLAEKARTFESAEAFVKAAKTMSIEEMGISREAAQLLFKDIKPGDGAADVTRVLTDFYNDAARSKMPKPATAEAAASKYWDDVIAPKIEKGEPVVLAGDDMKAHFGNDYDPARSDLYAKANFQNVQRALKEAPGDFAMLGGGPGSGKTEFLTKDILSKGFKGILYDTTLSNYAGAKKIIEEARAAGKDIRIYGIVTDLGRARGFTESRAGEIGREVTDAAFARGHAGFTATAKRLLEEGVVQPNEMSLYDMRNITDRKSADQLVQLGISERNPMDLLNKVQYNEDNITSLLKDRSYGKQGENGSRQARRGDEESGIVSESDRSSGIDRTDNGSGVGEDVSRGEARVGEEEPRGAGVKVSVPSEIDLSAKRAGLSDARAAQEQAIADAGKKQIIDKVPLPPSVGDILSESGHEIPIERTPATSINGLTGGTGGRSWQSILKGFMYNAGPQKRVHIFDYLATPEFVLEKIGMSKGAEMLQDAKDTYRTTLKREFSVLEDWKSSLSKTQYHTIGGVTKPHSPQDTSRLIFQYLDGKENVVAPYMSDHELDVARDIRAYLDDWADRLHLPKDNRISRYITHIFDLTAEGKPNESFIDPDMAAIMDETPAKSVYDPFLQRRMGKEGYVEDVWRALDAYVKRASRKEAMDPALENIESMAQRLDELTYKYVTKLTHRVNLRPTEIEKGLDSFITQTPIGYRFTNRPTAFLSRKIRQTFFRGTLGLNLSSALRNLTQGANTYAKLGEKYTAVGYAKIFGRIASRNLQELYDEGVLGDEFIQDKNIGLMKKGLQKVDKGLFAAFDFAEKINRGSAYFGAKAQAIDKGLSEAEAIKYAKRMVRETQFAFGTVDTPVALNDDVVKTLAQMQTFNIKQIEFLGRLAKQKDFAGMIRWTAASLAMVYTIGQLFGMTIEQLIPTVGLGGAPLTSAVTGAAEAFSSDPQTKAKGQSQVVRSLMSLLPGGSQLLKTIRGAVALQKGKVTTASGNFKYAVGTEDTARALIFGPNALPQAQEYYNTSAQDRTKEEFDRLKDIREKQGPEAAAAEWSKLNATDPSMQAKIKTYASEEALGYTDDDRAVKALGVTNGERAKKITDEINAADTKEEKQQIWKDYVAKKILTTDVQKQVTTLLEGGTPDTPTPPDPTVN